MRFDGQPTTWTDQSEFDLGGLQVRQRPGAASLPRSRSRGLSAFVAPQSRPAIPWQQQVPPFESSLHPHGAAIVSTPLPLSDPSPFRYRQTGTVKSLVRLQQLFDLTELEMSKLLGLQTVKEWRAVMEGSRSLELTIDRRERIRLLLTIHSLLDSLYGNEEAANRWLHSPVAEFEVSPLAHMVRGPMRSLYDVTDYLRGIAG
jgi:Protein of unknown function (DUF2384)